jgi:hypothetical protein
MEGIREPMGYLSLGDGNDAMEHSHNLFERVVALGGLAARNSSQRVAVDNGGW